MTYWEVDYSIFSSIIFDDIPEPTVDEEERFQAGLDTLHLQPRLRGHKGK